MNANYSIYSENISIYRNIPLVITFSIYFSLGYLNLQTIIETQEQIYEQVRYVQIGFLGLIAVYSFVFFILGLEKETPESLKEWQPIKIIRRGLPVYLTIIVIYAIIETLYNFNYFTLALMYNGFILLFGVNLFRHPESSTLFIHPQQFHIFVFDYDGNVIFEKDLFDLQQKQFSSFSDSIFIEQLSRSEEIGPIIKSIQAFMGELNMDYRDEKRHQKLEFTNRYIYVIKGDSLLIATMSRYQDKKLLKISQSLLSYLENKLFHNKSKLFQQQVLIKNLDFIENAISRNFKELLIKR